MQDDSTGPLGIDNVVALVVMTLAMMRRLEVIGTPADQNTHVSAEDFADWRRRALGAYNLAAGASALKVFLSFGWYYLFSSQSGYLQIGGAVIFMAWVLTVVAAWHKSTDASVIRKRLGIERRRSSP